MPNVQDLLPAPQQPTAPAKSSLGGLVGDAISVAWPEVSIYRQYSRDALAHDPWWELTQDKLAKLGEGLPTSYLEEFGQAESEAEALLIREQFLSLHRSRQELSRAGTAGTVLQAAASIVSPGQVAIALSTGGASTAARITWAGRAVAAAEMGLVAGVPNAALESVRANVDPEVGPLDVLTAGATGFGFGAAVDLTSGMGRGTRFLAGGAGQAAPATVIDSFRDDRTASDVIYAGTLGFLFGGAMNALHRTTAEMDATVTLKRAIEKETVDDAGLKLTPKGEAYFAKVAESQSEAGLVRRLELSEANDPVVPDAALTERELKTVADLVEPNPVRGPISYGIADAPIDELKVGRTVSSDETPPTQALPAIGKMTANQLRRELSAANVRFPTDATVPEMRAMIRRRRKETGAVTAKAEALPDGEVELTKAAVTRELLKEIPKEELSPGRQGMSQRKPTAMRLEEAGLDPESGLSEQARLMALVKAADLRGEFVSAAGQRLAGIKGADLNTGDAWDLDGKWKMEVVERDGDNLIIAATDARSAMPVGGGEYSKPSVYEFYLNAEDVIPVNSGTLKKAPAETAYRGEFKPVEGQQRGLLGEQYDGAITGEQTGLAFARPSEFAEEAADRPAPHASEENTGRLFQTAEYMADDPTFVGAQASTPSDQLVGGGPASAAAMRKGWYAKQSNRHPAEFDDFNPSIHTDTPAWNKQTPGAGVYMRNSIAGLNGVSKSSTVRKLTAQLVEDPLAKADGSPSRQSASEWARRRYEVDQVQFLRENRANFEAWAKANGTSLSALRPLARSRLLAEFNEQVGRAIRRETGTYTSDPHINRSVELWRDRIEKLWYLQNRHGVAGFDQIQPYFNYFTRLWSLTKLNAAINEHGEHLVIDLIAEAMSNKMGISPTEAAPYAKGMLRNILEARLGTDLDRAKLFDIPDVGAIREVLKRTVGTITDDEIDNFLFETVRNPESGLPERIRRRVSLDETHSKTGLFSRRALAIEDLLENDVEKIYSRYSHDAHGQSAVASVIESHRTSTTDDLSSYKQLLDRVRRDAMAAYGARTKDQAAKVNAEVLRLDAAFKSILGHRLGSDSRLAEAGKLLRAYNYLRVMGRAGLNEMQDFVGAIGETGFTSMVRSMPALANIIKQGRSGKISDPLLQEIEAFWAAGTDHFRGSVAHYLDPDAQLHAFGEHFDEVARRGGRVMNVVNLMAPVSSFNQRAILVAAEQKWLDIARSGKLPSAARLADMGLTSGEAQKIVDQMRQHSASKPGLFGRRIVAANLDQWDPEIRASFVAAMDRFSRSAVVRTDVGQLSRWMTTDWGKTIVQFRTYNVTAYEKNLLRNGRARDYQTFRTWAMNTLAGGLFYTAVEYINSVGRADANQYREKRLAPEMIARGAFQRAGFSTFLPGIVDSVIAPTGTALFDTRTSGLSSGLVRGIPTVDAIESFGTAVRGVVRPGRTDYQFSQGDFRGIRRMIPFQNALIVKNVLDAIETRLPDEARLAQ